MLVIFKISANGQGFAFVWAFLNVSLNLLQMFKRNI